MRNIEYFPDLKVGGVTVQERADRANRILSAYAREVNSDDLQAVIVDLFTDIAHLSRSMGVSRLRKAVNAALEHTRYESDPENHEASVPPPPFVINSEAFPDRTRHYIISGRILFDTEDCISHVEVTAGETRSAWEIFVEDVLFEGDLPDDWEEDSVIQGSTYEIAGPPIQYDGGV